MNEKKRGEFGRKRVVAERQSKGFLRASRNLLPDGKFKR